MDQDRTRAGSRRITRQDCRGTSIAADRRAIGTTSCAAGAGSRSAWVSGSRLDNAAGGGVDKRQFGISYHPAHTSRLLKRLNYSVQQPEEKAAQRDEAAINAWKEECWPALKKAQQEGRTIIFVDEAGFYLLPMLVRTYAPIGQTPTLRVPLTRDHLSAIGGITSDGRLFMQMQEYAYRAEHVVAFLRLLLRKIPGKLVVVWDGSPIHRANAVEAFLAAGAAKRLHLERLPGYAPELNPQEGIWNLLKRRELKNRCCSNLSLLRGELIRAKERLRHRKEILQSCVLHALGAL